MGKIIQPTVRVDNQNVNVSYITQWSTVTGDDRPPITYDKSSKSTNVNSNTKIVGDLTATGKVFNAVWNDYAELFLKNENEEYSYGDVVAYDFSKHTVTKSNGIFKSTVVGVVSDTYGMIVGGDKDVSLEDNLKKYVPVGLCGRVYVNIQPGVEHMIKPGVLLTSSTYEDGKATYVDSSNYIAGTVIGKALDYPKDGKVLMLVMLS